MSGVPRVVPLGACALMLLACGASPPKPAAIKQSPTPPAANSSLPTPPPPNSPAPTSLTITGATTTQVNGTRPQGACGKGPAGYGADLTFPLRGQQYVLSLELPDYRGPGRYPVPPERVSLHTESTAANPRLVAAVTGSVMVNQDERSGAIDATLSDHSQIKGTWACA